MTPKRRIIPVFVPHLGCPNDCVFCNQKRISGEQRPMTALLAKTEIEKALENIPAGADTQVAFYGGSFTAIDEALQRELLGAAQEFKNQNKISSIRLSTRPDCIDGEIVERLLLYGVKTVELGIQSLDDEVLLKSGRGHTAEDAGKAVKLLKEAGFEVICQMMTGLPGDTKEKSIKTADKIAAMKPDGVRIYPTVIIRDTALFDMWQSGFYSEHTVEEAAEWCCDILDIFERENVPVIRVGLNPTDDLSNASAVGGAYHPAFGQIVENKRYLKKAVNLIEEKYGKNVPEKLTFAVGNGQISTMVGQRKANVIWLKEHYGIKEIKVTEKDMEKGSLELL